MSDQKITALTELAATPDDADILPIVDDVAGTPVTKKITVANLLSIARTKTISLSAANIIAMNGTPVELVAAPGAGKVIIVDQVVASFEYGTVQFTGGGNVNIVTETEGTSIIIEIVTDTQMKAASSVVRTHTLQSAINYVTNRGIKITNTIAAFADGDSTMKIFIRYRILTI